ncbi:hypothetical protein DPMN_137637 [Dreissena polymorpha]|uniref:Uncharacterized protein n=1 Tax=Dreissena polymorpha TaxID=45954 RepID=A0A9D4G5M5_DREPO|nr:hypothetical protein DPMN_137637 [Dreissena polymorpha]
MYSVSCKGPKITSLPTASTLDEWQTAEQQLTTLTLTEDAADCVQTSSTYNEFNVKYEPATKGIKQYIPIYFGSSA